MFISELKLVNYRSYSRLTLEPAPGMNVIMGNNAEGKTNIVEAIFLCAFLRSHRTRHDGELIKRATEGAYVGVVAQTKLGSRSVEMTIPANDTKRIKLDSNAVTRIAEAMGVINVVMFAPEDLSIIKGAPEVRRRFIDMELSQLDTLYFENLQKYNKSLANRNAVLKHMGGDGAYVHVMPEDWENLKIWDEQVLIYGAKVMKTRAEFIEILNVEAAKIHSRITGGTEVLQVKYAPSIKMPAKPLEASYKKNFRQALRDTMGEEFRRRYTSAGPHKDDIDVLINGESAKTFGSQGQQRTAALALKLSEIELLKDIRKEVPIIILDDVLSELDEGRQKIIMSGIEEAQIFVTCTNIGELKNAFDGEMNVFEVKDGELIKL